MRRVKHYVGLAVLPAALYAGDASAVLLFADNFNRDDSVATDGSDLNTSGTGKSGTLAAATWSGSVLNGQNFINGNRLEIDADGSSGDNGGVAWINQNFTGLTSLSVSIDIVGNSSGGNLRTPGFGIGQALTDLTGSTLTEARDTPADVFVAYDSIGSTKGISVWHGVGPNPIAQAGTLSVPDTMSATFTFADMNAGTTINYKIFLNGVEIVALAGSTTWSGTNENYISLASNTQNGTLFDDLSIEGTLVPEPSSLALLGLGGLLIARRRRG